MIIIQIIINNLGRRINHVCDDDRETCFLRYRLSSIVQRFNAVLCSGSFPELEYFDLYTFHSIPAKLLALVTCTSEGNKKNHNWLSGVTLLLPKADLRHRQDSDSLPFQRLLFTLEFYPFECKPPRAKNNRSNNKR
jgi:hypothetical protein